MLWSSIPCPATQDIQFRNLLHNRAANGLLEVTHDPWPIWPMGHDLLNISDTTQFNIKKLLLKMLKFYLWYNVVFAILYPSKIGQAAFYRRETVL